MSYIVIYREPSPFNPLTRAPCFALQVLKWSLEMFRDVVKGDLALEEGNIELGDALFGSVEGKANAIEATFSNPIDTDS